MGCTAVAQTMCGDTFQELLAQHGIDVGALDGLIRFAVQQLLRYFRRWRDVLLALGTVPASENNTDNNSYDEDRAERDRKCCFVHYWDLSLSAVLVGGGEVCVGDDSVSTIKHLGHLAC